MCIAIAQPAESPTLDEKTLKACFEANGDGLGFMYSHNGRLVIRKNYWKPRWNPEWDFDRFYQDYYMMHKTYGKSSPFALHFRISTSGNVNRENSHPFLVRKGIGLIHNGVLPMPKTGGSIEHLFADKDVNPRYSDTWHYANLYFNDAPTCILHDDKYIDAVASFIGTGNKLVFLDDTREIRPYPALRIVNAAQGTWARGIWFSNNSWVVDGHNDHWLPLLERRTWRSCKRARSYAYSAAPCELSPFRSAAAGYKLPRLQPDGGWADDEVQEYILLTDLVSPKGRVRSIYLDQWGAVCRFVDIGSGYSGYGREVKLQSGEWVPETYDEARQRRQLAEMYGDEV